MATTQLYVPTIHITISLRQIIAQSLIRLKLALDSNSAGELLKLYTLPCQVLDHPIGCWVSGRRLLLELLFDMIKFRMSISTTYPLKIYLPRSSLDQCQFEDCSIKSWIQVNVHMF